jgi:hypothetical protein
MLATTVSLAALAAGCFDGGARSGPWYDWRVIRLEIQEMPFISGSVEMRVRHDGDGTRFETTSTARLLGARVAESSSSTLIDKDGRTLRFESRSGEDGRRYLFERGRYSVEKLSAEGDPSRPLDDWHVTSRREFELPVDPSGSPVDVYDYFGMIYALRGADLHEVGDEALLHVATSDGPVGFRVRVDESRETLRTFHDADDGTLRQVEATELRLRVAPEDPANSSEGFLRMEGETEIWVEAESKTLLQVSGKVPRVPGTIRLMLTELG